MSEERIEEYRRRLEEYEKKQNKLSQSIDLKDLAKKTRELKSVYIEGLGELKYGALTFMDLVEVSKYQADEERAIAIIYHMLKKAYPDLALEDVRNLPFDVSSKIMIALSRDLSFLTATS